MKIIPANTSLIIPTYNAGVGLELLLQSIGEQTFVPKNLLIIDSSSTDMTVDLVQKYGFEVHIIKKNEFNHGGTRQLAVNRLSNIEYLLFLTQDIIIQNKEAIKQLMNCFNDETIGAAFGRQLPHKNAHLIEAHARLFNYPGQSLVKSVDDIPRYGIKTAFISNSFAAYRRRALMEVNGFPKDVILSEDTYVAANMLLKGWQIAYCAEAQVYHSHNYSYIEEFRRYFDIGVFYGRESWIKQQFGQAEGEGLRYVRSELNYLLKNNFLLIPSALLRSFLKFVAYRLGMFENHLPNRLKRSLSMNKIYWNL